MHWYSIFLGAAGLFAICGAAFEWNFFMNNHKARFIGAIFGRTGARVFYMLLGTFLVVLGILGAFGMIDVSKDI